MDAEKIKADLTERLMIPVSNITLHERFISVFVKEKPIGNIPYYRTPGNIIYDTDKIILGFLNWSFIVKLCKNEMLDSIAVILGYKYQHITPGDFWILAVRHHAEDSAFKEVKCYYQDNLWMVQLLK